jgi:hypothetical protein
MPTYKKTNCNCIIFELSVSTEVKFFLAGTTNYYKEVKIFERGPKHVAKEDK